MISQPQTQKRSVYSFVWSSFDAPEHVSHHAAAVKNNDMSINYQKKNCIMQMYLPNIPIPIVYCKKSLIYFKFFWYLIITIIVFVWLVSIFHIKIIETVSISVSVTWLWLSIILICTHFNIFYTLAQLKFQKVQWLVSDVMDRLWQTLFCFPLFHWLEKGDLEEQRSHFCQ